MIRPKRSLVLLAFLTCLLVGELAVAGWLNFRLVRQNNRTREALARQWNKVRLANEALHNSVRNSRISLEVFLLKDRKEIATRLAERSQHTDRVSELLEQLETKTDSPHEDAMIKAIWSARIPYADSYKEALALLVDRHKYDEARIRMVRVTLPNLQVYHEAWETFVQFQWEQLAKVGTGARANAASAHRRISCLLGLAILTGIGEFILALRWSRNLKSRSRPAPAARESLEPAESALHR
jgi:hypothetical protein